ncbi:MAG: nickel pincer cofactor biosynthesis protein LarC [Magnetococcales bacterium]|nr:nickel pincer cofactor biosynthesis protein LarC [Magnetococcales bacterium]
MKLHLDMPSGIAGNMFLAAAIDLGVEVAPLQQALQSVLQGWRWTITPGRRGGLRGLHLEVHEESHQEADGHGHDHPTHHHHHPHRHLGEILALVDHSALPEPVKQLAATIFRRLAEAEAVVHGIEIAEVHFHEVGAVDAIIDICGAAYACWALGVSSCSASALATGSGFVDCAHGRLPIPAPAVAELLRRYRVPLLADPVNGELVTPTGAAILVTLAERYGACPLTRIDRVGQGLGSREIAGRANLLRLLAQEEEENEATLLREWVTVLTTHIDDMNPEWYGALSDHLWQAGVLDVALLPITMKKGRPGVRLEVMAETEQAERVAALILHHSTALGVRLTPTERLILPRRLREITTPWGMVRVKEAGERCKIEYADLLAVAEGQGWSLLQAQERLLPYLQSV